jgi:hypothetical protein
MSPTPLVSVVLATYNRSAVLAHAVESVRRSTLADWELLVVGDHCTDDSAAVVEAFGDARIRFVNLPHNAGEQSGPNNEGLRLARGRYVAFLNHDDMYFPDHLAAAVAALDTAAADLVWSPLLVALPVSGDDLAAGRWRFRLRGVPPGGDGYDPRLFVLASAWVLPRTLAQHVGLWRPARETYVTSSQDWLFRVWRSGARMQMLPEVNVLAVPASERHGSYLAAASPEHEIFSARMRDDRGFRAHALALAAIEGERMANRFRFGQSLSDLLQAMAFRPVSAAAVALGVHPYAPWFALRHGRRGNVVSMVRRRSGLDALRRDG